MNTWRALTLIAWLGIAACSGSGGNGASGNNPPPPPAQPPPPGNDSADDVPLTPVAHLRFTDVTVASGLRFAHALIGNTLAEQIAAGVAVGDYDGDGWLDVYLAQGNSGENRLFANRSEGGTLAFVDVTVAAGVGGSVNDKASGPAFVDYDGDGDQDLLVGSVEYTPVRVFNNLGDGTFSDVSESSGLVDNGRENNIGFAFGDFDQDADLDLFMAHWTFTPNELPATNAGHLWRNNGDGTFTDVSDVTLVSPAIIEKPNDYTFSPTFADIDDDGDADLLVVADTNTSQVLLNNGDLGGGLYTFNSATDRGVISDEAGMGSSVADFDNDGDLDWFVTSISLGDDEGGRPTKDDNAGFNLSGNRFYRNVGNGVFVDETEPAGLRKGYWGWGSCAADFNNDGLLDIFHVNGMDDPNTGAYLDDPSRLFINNGDGSFTEYSEALELVDRQSGRGLSCFDGDQDGDIDIVVANNNDTATLFRNDGGNQLNYVNIRLEAPRPNTQAIGARIYLTSNGVTQMREVHNGNNFVSQNPAEQHFGLANATIVDSVEIVWPDRTRTRRLNVQPFQRISVTYPDRWSTD